MNPYVLTIGDIGITTDSVVTPNGSAPLAGAQWIAMDQTVTVRKIPVWAIVCAIIFSLACLLGLFFLLAKEERPEGYVSVSVRSGSLSHAVQIPVHSVRDIAKVRALVAQAQTLTAQAASHSGEIEGA